MNIFNNRNEQNIPQYHPQPSTSSSCKVENRIEQCISLHSNKECTISDSDSDAGISETDQENETEYDISSFETDENIVNIDSSYEEDDSLNYNDTEMTDTDQCDSDRNSDLDSDDDTDSDYFQNTEKVHPNLSCNVSELLMMIMIIYLKHNLSWTALVDLLTLINTIFGRTIIPPSKYLFKKMFPLKTKPEFNYFCSSCFLLFDENVQVSESCPNCNISLVNSRKNNFFITLSILPQIRQILKKNFTELIGLKCTTKISDIFNSRQYIKIIDQCNNFARLITLNFNTDGVKIFNSKRKGSFWPLQFIINELNPKVRFKTENIVVCGFWFGGTPVMEIFFKPFIKEIMEINKEFLQIIVQNIKYYFILRPLICTVDTPAKDKIQKKVQFNGYFGCSYCKHPGTLVQLKPGGKQKQVRYTISNFLIDSRTHKNALVDMEQATQLNEICNGFRGITPLAAINKFDVISGFSIDYMHAVLLGVVRQLLDIWFNSSGFREKFYIGLRRHAVDERLLRIKPPSNISRKPRSIEERNIWKANELRNWLLYYGIPCLIDILPIKYLNHFALLSDSIYSLLNTQQSTTTVSIASQNLQKFVKDFEYFYGPSSMTYNVHLMGHISKCVLDCGPLWCYSNFCFENNNGVLMKYVKGTKDVEKQIVSKYSFHNIISFATKSDTVKNFESQIDSKRLYLQRYETRFLGKGSEHILTDLEKNAFNNSSYALPDNCQIKIFNRIRLHNEIYSSTKYSVNIKSDDSMVILNDGNFVSINSFFEYENIAFFIGEIKKIDVKHNVSLLCQHLKVLTSFGSENLRVFNVNVIKEKCIYMKFNNFSTVALFPNKYEID